MPAEQPDFDFFDEIAVQSEQLRDRVVKRLNALQVATESRPGARELQYTLDQARKQAIKLASARTETGGTHA